MPSRDYADEAAQKIAEDDALFHDCNCEVVVCAAHVQPRIAAIIRAAGRPSVSSERLQEFIDHTEASHFRTPYDTGANLNALFVWNLVRRFAGMERLTMAALQLRAGLSDEQMAENERLKKQLNQPAPSSREAGLREAAAIAKAYATTKREKYAEERRTASNVDFTDPVLRFMQGEISGAEALEDSILSLLLPSEGKG